MKSSFDDLWVITTYFNPIRYRRRKQNYHHFRQHLDAPLLTVELSHDGQYELGPGDADLLVQITGPDVMWQKERLLNVALKALPSSCTYVAWLDADVIFADSGWRSLLREKLKIHPLVQAFKFLYDLPKNALPHTFNWQASTPTAYSFIYKSTIADTGTLFFRPANTALARISMAGLAWAARKELLDQHGFYDALIIGGGDRAMACAAVGRYEDAQYMACLKGRRAQHYLAWATAFHESVKGNVGYIDATLLHLWHGEIADRQYNERHQTLSTFDFDPYTDLCLDAEGSWRWNTPNHELRAYLKHYFAHRLEDGRVSPPES